MAAHRAPEQADSPAGILAAVRSSREAADREEARILALAVDWVELHPDDEYAVAELAAALRVSTDAGRSLVEEAVELTHRLRRTWVRVQAGDLPAWRARRIARSTLLLSRDGAV